MKQYKLGILLEAKDKFSAPMKKIAHGIRGVKGPIRDLKASFSGLNSISKRLSSRLGYSLVGAISAGTAAVMKFAATGDNIAKTADKVGLSSEMLQKYRYAADRAGVANEKFDSSFERFTRNIAEARRGMGTAVYALKDLNIGLTNNGKLKSNVELFEEIADRIKGIEDPALKMGVAFNLFGRSGGSMLNMMKDGAKGIRDLGIELEGLGAVWSNQTTRDSEKVIDSWTRVKAALGGVAGTLLGEYQPKIIAFLENIVEKFETNKDAIVNQIKAGIETAVTWSKRLLGVWVGIKGLQIAKLVYDIGAALFFAGKGIVAFTIALATNPFGAIIAGIGIVTTGIILLIKNWDSIGPAIARGIAWFGNGMKRIGKIMWGWISGAWDFGVQWVMNLWGGIKHIWGAFTDWLGSFFDFGGATPGISAPRSAAMGPPVNGGAAAASAPMSRFQGRLAIDINGPPGTRVASVEQSGNADMSVDTGLYMAMG